MLAIILILAIITFIAIPIISKSIKEFKKNAYVVEAQNFLNAAENAVVLKQFNTPKETIDDSLIILISDLDISKNNNKSPYGQYYLSGSNVTVTSDITGNLIYTITLFDEGNNAIINQTYETLGELGGNALVNTNPEDANITLPRAFAVGDKVNLKDSGGSFTVIKEAVLGATEVTLFADYVMKTDLTGFDTSCAGTAPYCSMVQFDNDAYNATLNLAATTSSNIGYYVTNYQNNLITKYSNTNIKVELPTLQTLLDLTGSVSLEAIRTSLSKEANARDLNLQSLNLYSIDILYNGQNYWFNSTWLDPDSGKNWYWYTRDSYGKVIDAYWSSHNSVAGFRPIITIPVKYVN